MSGFGPSPYMRQSVDPQLDQFSGRGMRSDSYSQMKNSFDALYRERAPMNPGDYLPRDILGEIQPRRDYDFNSMNSRSPHFSGYMNSIQQPLQFNRPQPIQQQSQQEVSQEADIECQQLAE